MTHYYRTCDAGEPPLLQVFGAVLWRDLFVTLRDLPFFLTQVLFQPLFLLFVFGRILVEIGETRSGYSDLLFPGILALVSVLTSLQGTALPLVVDFSYSREIEDRLLAPLPVMLVAVEKMVFASIRSMTAVALMFPLGFWILGTLTIHADGLWLLLLTVLVGSLMGAAIGMTFGTLVAPARINVMFALVLAPLIFTGCTQYPWPSLARLRWFQVLTAFNPLTYVSETMRGAVVPSIPHMLLAVSIPAMFAFTAFFVFLGMYGFRRRAIE